MPDFGRFIPACAGNAQSRTGGERESSVHPRMRGERQWMHAAALALDGSSPHARGTHSMDASVDRHHRFIPACAGNAREQCRRGRLRSVHPRMRGERALTIGGAVLAAGSSPHARGTPRGARADRFPGRFIPACAGNARFPFRKSSEYTVHPRMRGERVSVGLDAARSSGSSPHARGTRLRAQLVRAGGRFIPACAGNA